LESLWPQSTWVLNDDLRVFVTTKTETDQNLFWKGSINVKSSSVGQDSESGDINWQTDPKAGNSEGSHSAGVPGVSEDVRRIKSGDIQDWQCYPSTATQAEADASPTGMSFTPDVDGHQDDKGYEQHEVTAEPNTQSIPYGPKPSPAAR